jgi:hypothetical protein
MTSGFFALLGCYTTYIGSYDTIDSGHPVGSPSLSSLTAGHWNMLLTGCPRTPVTNYPSTLLTSQTSEDIIACYSTEYKKYAMPLELN